MKNDYITYGKLKEIDTQKLLNRGNIPDEVKERVRTIVEKVKTEKLKAILEYTSKFDGITLTAQNVKVTQKEIDEAYTKINSEQLDSIKESIKRVYLFHKKQKETVQDTTLATEEGNTQLRWIPLKRVGIYAPAGQAPLPSCVIMAAIPANVTRVKEIILCSAPQKDGKIDPAILVAAKECNIKEIYKIGGAQAIAAMAYGCQLFDSVDLIAGPGNVYTAYAKQFVASEGTVKIDTIAGPSEVMILADDTPNPEFVASDMLAQAEHGTNSAAICITTSSKFAAELKTILAKQLDLIPNKQALTQSLIQYGAILIADKISEGIEFVNKFAPEHVEIYTKDAQEIAPQITNAGAVFIKTGEVFGDYGMSGSNHILPTGSAARFTSGVSVYTFMKYQLVEEINQKSQALLAKATATFARMEKLEAHARSAEKRGEINEY